MKRSLSAASLAALLAWAAPAPAQECKTIHPQAVALSQADGKWKMLDGKAVLFDFGSRDDHARRALNAIQRYLPDEYCSLSKNFNYILTGGVPPSGSSNDENCLELRVSNLKVEQAANGRWKILETVPGNKGMWHFDFESDEASARKGLEAIKKYGFTYSCFATPFTYLRR